ncbi:MAG: hypothetical protein M3M85_02805 [bacterium]|nr:hypothetical protein [bacterium]
MLLRILVSVVLLFSVLYLPFWVSVILALAGMAYFSVYWEAVVLFLILDALAGVPEARFFGFTFVAFVLSLLLLVATEIIKGKLKFYK